MLNFKVYKSWTTGLVRFQVEFFKLELEIRLSSLQCLASGETFKMLEKNSLKLCGNCVLRTLQPRFNCSYFSGARLGPHSPALLSPHPNIGRIFTARALLVAPQLYTQCCPLSVRSSHFFSKSNSSNMSAAQWSASYWPCCWWDVLNKTVDKILVKVL